MSDIKELIKSKLTPIGDAIREKDGSTELIPIDDMPQAIRNIQGGSVNVVKQGSWVRTQVANSGLVENVYLNTALSIEEVNSYLDSITYDFKREHYIILSEDNLRFIIIKHVTAGPTGYYIGYGDSSINMGRGYLFVSSKELAQVYGTDFVGWNPEFDGIYNVDSNVVSTISIAGETINVGAENDKLTSLFSLTPFTQETETVTLSGDYDGSTLETELVTDWQGTQVPNNTYVEKVYFNTNLTVEEVLSLASKLTFDEASSQYNIVLGIDGNVGKLLMITPHGNINYMEMDITTNKLAKYVSIHNSDGDTVGWQVDNVEINVDALSDMDGMTIGAENDKLTQLFSTTPFTPPNTIDIKALLEEKKLPLSIKVNVESDSANVVKQGGTLVPNSGTISEIYFNTNLSVEEVKSILDTLTFIDIGGGMGMYVGLQGSNNANNFLSIMKNNGNYFIMFEAYEGSFVFASAIDETLGTTFAGWIDGFNGVIEVNDTLSTEMDGMTIGAENDKLTDLISATPFENKVIKTLEGNYKAVDIVVTENKTVDIETYLDNKQMPMSFKVNVPKVSVLELQYTPLVFGTVSSKIHFNTNLTTEEVDAILNNENLDYYVDYENADTAVYLIQFGETAESYYKLMLITKNYNKITKKSTFSINYGTTGGNTSIYNSTDGWLNSDYIPAVTINAFASADNSESTANKNFKLLELLFSSSPYNYEEIKVLEGDYKAIDLTFNEIPSVWKGTPLKNDLNVEKVYFNDKLTVEEVDAILDTLTYDSALDHNITDYKVAEGQYGRIFVMHGSQYGLSGFAIKTITDFIYVSNQEVVDFILSYLGETVKVGWNLSELQIDNTLSNVSAEIDKLSSLVSASEFILDNTIDLEQYLDNKQMPMSVKVNVESDSVNIVKSSGTVVPNSGYVENVYLNSKYITDNPSEEALKELYDILSSIQYISYSNMLIYALVSNADMTYGLSIGKAINNTSGVIKELYNIIYTNNNNTIEYLSIQKNLNTGDIVYNYNFDKIEDLSNVISFNFENQVSVLAEQLGGTLQNEKLTQLFSSTPFENQIIKELSGDYKAVDLEVTENTTVYVGAMLDDGKIPMSVTVNVASSGEDRLKRVIVARQSTSYLFEAFQGESVDDLISYDDTCNVTTMSYMFCMCSKLITIPLLNTRNVNNMYYMCYDCFKLQEIKQLDMISVTKATYMFDGCKALTNLTLLNIKVNLKISNGTSWGHLLTLDSLINTVKELINTGSARTLTMGTANLNKIASTYVKFTYSSVTTIPTNEKGDVVVCESTDTGAMLLQDYALLKNWTLA